MRQRLSALITMLVLVLVGGLAAAAPAAAAPGAPVLGAVPARSTNPVLTWSAPTGAVRYSVQVASQSDFASTAVKFNVTVANTAATPPNDLPVGQYWWRVRAADAKGAFGPYSTGTFTKTSGTIPSPLLPANGTQLKYPTDSLVLSWSVLAGIKTYEVQVDDDAAFVGAPAPISTTNTSFTPSNPPFNTTWYWRVRGKSSTGVATDWSSVWSYSMTWPSAQMPALTSPADGANVEEINLDWAPLVGANSYELQISPDQFFNAPIGGTRVVNSTAFSPSPTLPAGAYYWRVRGLSAVLNAATKPEPSQWSQVRTFTRAWPAVGSLPNGTTGKWAQVKLVSPVNGENTIQEPTFTWQPQREASNYEFQIGPDANFSAGTYSTCYTDHTTVTPYVRVTPFTNNPSPPYCNPSVPFKLTPGGVAYWRVRGLDAPATTPTVLGVWSEVWRMQYNPSGMTQSVSYAGVVPVLKWTAVPNISHYKVTIARAPGNTDTDCATVTAITYNTSYVPENISMKCEGELAWTVQSQEDDGDLSKIAFQSGWPTFTLTQPTAQSSLGVVALTASDGLRPPTMQWNGLTGAASYRVWFSVAGENSFVLAHTKTLLPGFAYTGQGGGWPVSLTPGSYDFFVEALDATNQSIAQSGLQSFTISSTWPSVTLTSPCVGSAAGPQCVQYDTPTLDWEPLPKIGLYNVYLATDPNFTNVLWNWQTSFTELTPVESLPDSQAGQAYYWYVRPCVNKGSCGPFDPSVFSNAGAFRKVSLPVKAISPAGGASVAHEVTFQWEDYLATNYPFNGTAAGRVTQEAESYQVQVSTTAEFTNIIETSPMIDQTRYTAQTTTYPEGPLYWRVRAYDQTGNPLTYSCGPVANGPQPACAAFAFTKSSPTPALTLPAPGAQVPSAPTLAWAPMAYAKTYEVEIYSGTAVDPSAKVTTLTTSSTSVIGKTPLAAGTYGWRARWIDAKGLPGRWTSEGALRTFVVAGNTVTLRLPANGGKVSDNRVVLQWDPVPGAARYKAEASLDSGFGTVLEAVTTDQPAWAPGMSFPAWPSGKIYWRVTALDANNAKLSASPVWSFVKGTAAMTVTRYAGSDRFGTAVEVSKATFPSAGVPVAYVATGSNFADALAGGPAAYKQGGPVLLVAQNAIPSVVAGELGRLKPARIVILGGTGAVSAAVATKLDGYTTGPVVRLAGANRFDTAGQVALYAFGTSGKAYIANGTNYPDALAGAVAAATKGVPLLLVTATDVPAPTKSAMTKLGVTSSTVLGGTGVVSPAVMSAVQGTVRLAGSNRYSTAVAISKATFPTANAVFLATGSNFPDALAGTPSAAKRVAPLLLANGGCLTADTVAEIQRLGASTVYVLGGTGAVPESAARLTTC